MNQISRITEFLGENPTVTGEQVDTVIDQVVDSFPLNLRKGKARFNRQVSSKWRQNDSESDVTATV
jgi:hypothetical protein